MVKKLNKLSIKLMNAYLQMKTKNETMIYDIVLKEYSQINKTPERPITIKTPPAPKKKITTFTINN
jgi:hypothetical protein